MGIKIGNIDASYFKVGSGDCSIYLGTILLYSGGTTPPTPPTPTGCYEVIPDPITAYTATTYDSVYSWSDEKWYMKNNLDEYEEYGVYDIVEDISSATTYEGKLAAVGTTEYEYSGGSWTVVGTYENIQTTLTITDEDEYAYSGQTLPTTFKIPKEEMDNVGNFPINDTNGGNLNVRRNRYVYYGDDRYEGTVTSDSVYYYYSMETPQSIVIDSINYYEPDPLHLTYGTKEVSVEYTPKEMPLGKVYQSSSAMQADTCPSIGVGQNGVVSDNVYVFTSNGTWTTVSNVKFIGTYDNVANVLTCNSSSALTSGETQPSYIKSSMTSAIIGECVSEITDSAFDGCISLTSVTIPSSVTSIGQAAFRQCSGLTSVTIGNSVEIIDRYAFNGCSSLTSVTIPGSVTSIGNMAFNYCTRLTSVTIGSGVTSIDDGAFQMCRSLTSITIPDSVTSIGIGAFAYCNSLTSVTIGSGVESIGNSAFRSCSGLTSVTIPNSVTSIGNTAFNSCIGLTSVTCLAVTPPTLGTNAFQNATSLSVIYVPSESVSAYKSAWSTYASRIQAIPNS